MTREEFMYEFFRYSTQEDWVFHPAIKSNPIRHAALTRKTLGPCPNICPISFVAGIRGLGIFCTETSWEAGQALGLDHNDIVDLWSAADGVFLYEPNVRHLRRMMLVATRLKEPA